MESSKLEQNMRKERAVWTLHLHGFYGRVLTVECSLVKVNDS